MSGNYDTGLIIVFAIAGGLYILGVLIFYNIQNAYEKN